MNTSFHSIIQLAILPSHLVINYLNLAAASIGNDNAVVIIYYGDYIEEVVCEKKNVKRKTRFRLIWYSSYIMEM